MTKSKEILYWRHSERTESWAVTLLTLGAESPRQGQAPMMTPSDALTLGAQGPRRGSPSALWGLAARAAEADCPRAASSVIVGCRADWLARLDPYVLDQAIQT